MGHFLASMNPVMFTLITAGVGVAGVAAFVIGVRLLRRATTVAATPTSALRSAAQGFGEFEGRAELLPGPPIVAPLTGTVCVWYRCTVFERPTEGSRGGVVSDETSDGLFLLRDYTGSSVVDPDGAVVTPSESAEWYTDSLLMGAISPDVAPLVGRFRCREERIRERARLYVMGHFSTQGSVQEVPDTPAETRALLKSWKRDHGWLLQRFDADGDGVIDEREWAAVRAAAGAEVARLQRERFGEGTMNLISKPHDGREFIISTAGEEHLVRRWRREALLAFGGFIAATWLVAWALSARF